ncbi:MAG TPA: hypothetical protein VF590_22100 [Isosphaeraceae bacterium]|jgi:hypothetical protein
MCAPRIEQIDEEIPRGGVVPQVVSPLDGAFLDDIDVPSDQGSAAVKLVAMPGTACVPGPPGPCRVASRAPGGSAEGEGEPPSGCGDLRELIRRRYERIAWEAALQADAERRESTPSPFRLVRLVRRLLAPPLKVSRRDRTPR